MIINIALVGPNHSFLEAAGSTIRSLEKRTIDIHIYYYHETESLIEEILNFDIVAISDEIFKIGLPRLQEVLMEKSKAIKSKKKIVLANLKTPLAKSTIKKWLDELDLDGEELAIPVHNGMKHEKISEIVYFECSNRKVYVKTAANYYETKLKMIDVRENVKNLDFEVPYASFVINLFWVECIKGKDVMMKNGDIIPLSQKKAHTFKKAFKAFLSYLH